CDGFRSARGDRLLGSRRGSWNDRAGRPRGSARRRRPAEGPCATSVAASAAHGGTTIAAGWDPDAYVSVSFTGRGVDVKPPGGNSASPPREPVRPGRRTPWRPSAG